ncbi:MAG: MBL fold metallo-hydrolase [candidate division WOR-3 bacterium]|jgi:glyoxylase-like metal-dependent hydrolase (beta-lactamase superfamily II)
MNIGDFTLWPLFDGYFGLDGGAMFGVVPKPLWEKTNPPDERNRIKLALRPLLVITPTERILIDTGIGDKYEQKFADRYRIERPDNLLNSLKNKSLNEQDIGIVILTHLHFDHCGGSTKYEAGRVVPTFPNARYIVQEAEWNEAVNPNRRSRASYLPENFLPLKEAGQLELVNGSLEILPGIELIHTGGHTGGMQVVKISSHGQTAFFWSDMIPTRSHIPVPYIMGYDLYPLDSMAQKEKLLARAVAEGWISFLEHDPEVTAGRIFYEDDKYRFEAIEI